MGLDLSCRAGDDLLEFRVTYMDWEMIQGTRVHMPKEVEVLVDVPALGGKIRLSAGDLRSAAQRLCDFLDAHPDALPRTYEYKDKLPDHLKSQYPNYDPTRARYSTGGTSGIRMPNDPDHFYAMDAGFDLCNLERWKPGDRAPNEIRDIRHLTELVTADRGTIKIRSRPTRSAIRGVLKKILKFLDRPDDQEVIKSAG